MPATGVLHKSIKHVKSIYSNTLRLTYIYIFILVAWPENYHWVVGFLLFPWANEHNFVSLCTQTVAAA